MDRFVVSPMVRPAARSQPLLLLPLLLAVSACAGAGPRRFLLRDPVWVDPDTQPLAVAPARYYSGEYADGLDQIALRPLSRALAVPGRDESWNVNSLDEVPDSSWFHNRLGQHVLSPAQVARGACGNLPGLNRQPGPWSVVAGKPDGDNSGFTIQASDGYRYLLKFDGAGQPQRITTADVVGSKIFHAAGYHTPCNEIVHFSETVLRLAPGAKVTDRYGQRRPMTQQDLDRILEAAWRRRDGQLRAMASRFLVGSPLGPFRYEGTRDDDPNDVIPHQKRRELRASRLLAAWINHVDAREQNSLDMLVQQDGRRFVRHHLLDWGDSCGALWPSQAFSRRLGIGRSGYLDLDHVLTDLFTLGMYPRPWHRVSAAPYWPTFGYFSEAHFSPLQWRPGYSNPAFVEMTDADALWMARIIARFSDAHLAAIVAEAQLEPAGLAQYLTAVLSARRDVILRDTLGRGSPLADFSLTTAADGSGQSLCFTDLALRTGVASLEGTAYQAQLRGGVGLDRNLGWLQFRPELTLGGPGCLPLPIRPRRPADLAGASAAPDHPLRYAVLEIRTQRLGPFKLDPAVRLHLYDLGPALGFRLVGIERDLESTEGQR